MIITHEQFLAANAVSCKCADCKARRKRERHATVIVDKIRAWVRDKDRERIWTDVGKAYQRGYRDAQKHVNDILNGSAEG